MPTRVRLHAVSGTIVVSAEERDDVGIGPDAVREVGDDGTIEVHGKKKSSPLHVSVPVGSDVTVGTVSGDIELIGVLGSVRVTSTSGSIEVDWAETADLRTTSGRVVVGKCSGMCRVSNKSGKVVVNDVGEGAISSVSGSVHIDAKSLVEVRTVSGKVDVQSGAGGPVRVHTVSGSIEVGLPPGVKPNVRLGGRGKVRNDYEPGDDVQVEVRTVSGQIAIAARSMAPAPGRSKRPRPRPRRSGARSCSPTSSGSPSSPRSTATMPRSRCSHAQEDARRRRAPAGRAVS